MSISATLQILVPLVLCLGTSEIILPRENPNLVGARQLSNIKGFAHTLPRPRSL